MSDLPLIIIPAAGSSKRFKDVGIDTPKGLIRFQYRGYTQSMIDHVINMDAEALVVASDPWYAKYQEENDTFWKVLMIKESKGQADTIRQACETLTDEPILVLNSDCCIEYPLDVFCKQCSWASTGVLVFAGHGNTAYSYVNMMPLFNFAVEKEPIYWAIAGAYYFRSSKELANVVRMQMDEEAIHNNEYYLSGALNYMPPDRLSIVMKESQFKNWGTPEDLARDRTITITDPQIEAILATMR